MGVSRIVGAVAGLWRFPVKSMRGERLEQAELTERGLVGDGAYALTDADTGKVVSSKSAGLYPDLFGCRVVFVEPPRSGGELPPVQIALPVCSPVRAFTPWSKRQERCKQVTAWPSPELKRS